MISRSPHRRLLLLFVTAAISAIVGWSAFAAMFAGLGRAPILSRQWHNIIVARRKAQCSTSWHYGGFDVAEDVMKNYEKRMKQEMNAEMNLMADFAMSMT